MARLVRSPIEQLAAEELPSFDDDAQRDIYDLLARADAAGVASARIGGTTVEVELREAS